MQRRLFLSSLPLLGGALAASLTACATRPPARASGGAATAADFDAALAEAIRTAEIDSSRSWRELEFRADALTETQTSMAGRRSERMIHPRAIELIVSAEISNRARYEKAYRQPTWPGGRSGVTIGFGYDLGFVHPTAFADHWQDLLTREQIRALTPVCRLQGNTAAGRVADVREVRVDWDAADKQFRRFLPFVIAETEDTFPNCAELSDMSLGALVSLVYNRGSDTDPNKPRRVHMHYCRQAMQQRRFDAIPRYLRDMKAIWANEQNARGLLIRRELEAKLFEAGLS